MTHPAAAPDFAGAPGIALSTEPPRTPDAVKALWDGVGFAEGRDPEAVMRCLMGSNLVVTAWDGEQLVGTTRVITDGVYYATLWDVIVHPAYRGRGIGTALVQRAIAPFLGRGFSYIALFSVAGGEAFYERLGFSRHPSGMRLTDTGARALPPPT